MSPPSSIAMAGTLTLVDAEASLPLLGGPLPAHALKLRRGHVAPAQQHDGHAPHIQGRPVVVAHHRHQGGQVWLQLGLWGRLCDIALSGRRKASASTSTSSGRLQSLLLLLVGGNGILGPSCGPTCGAAVWQACSTREAIIGVREVTLC